MRIIWWKISRPADPLAETFQAQGQSYQIHLPEDWWPQNPSPEAGAYDREWLNRLLNWSEDRPNPPRSSP
ncbi:hypothetical protein TPY_1523 [Sulfobacillus acidophilus TPY]|jgi:hypothetical protein|uniref:Uncharacterized protein n=1 Tax=Sulfobacillus acidophilus (strain ATCC 700253 / DSM 10332 / NAL) TaxID=679936 RepID=G8U126_SULAD|nr:hypothetical protein TPY_1523 [Sulfobacillus acidophilus TPY]AEW04259.1 hypothetical protein Sulac_0752 [Sulfobacillus acidophilus DSM 10332]MCY0865721.1 hypothetical protein [Sulfobacillus sp.]